jgi:hypothetical protein
MVVSQERRFGRIQSSNGLRPVHSKGEKWVSDRIISYFELQTVSWQLIANHNNY